jgi:hypothetical protein
MHFLHRLSLALLLISLELDNMKSGYETTLIPMNMVEIVDAGVNPDQIQKQQIQTLVDKNQKLNGRIRSLKVFLISFIFIISSY